MNRKLTLLVLPLLGLLLLSGCTTPKRDPAFAAVRPTISAPPPQNTGSIYQSGSEVAWFEDLKARRVGDVLTIVLQESTNASKQAASETSKETAITYANPTVMGANVQFNAPGIVPLASNKNLNLGVEVDNTHSFKGEGTSSQKNSLTGTISVTVSEVLPNGNLVVRGEKLVRLSDGDEFVRISGMVRPIDIAPDNTISSSKVADAQVIYEGEGQVADAKTMGWLARFFISAIWPF